MAPPGDTAFRQRSPHVYPPPQALTQHHFVLLYPSKLQFVNRTSKGVVQEVPLERFAAPLRGAGTMPLGLCRDHVGGHIYVLAGALRGRWGPPRPPACRPAPRPARATPPCTPLMTP